MTSSNDPKDLNECTRLGVEGYIPKPVTFTTFSKAVADLFHCADHQKLREGGISSDGGVGGGFSPVVCNFSMSVTRETLRIVLVENDPDDLFFLERALDKEGFNHPVVHLRDGMEAMNYFSALQAPDADLPDIVLTDLKMPRMDGVDFLQWLRGTPRLQELPVIVLTSSSETSDMRQTNRLGIFKFVTKQVRFENLTTALKMFLLAVNTGAPTRQA